MNVVEYGVYLSFWLTSLCIRGFRFIHLIKTDSMIFLGKTGHSLALLPFILWYQQFHPELLLSHQGKCQHSKKGKGYLVLLGKEFWPPGFSERVSSRSLHIILRELQILQIQLLPPVNSKQFRKANNIHTHQRIVIGTVIETGTILKCLTEIIPLNFHNTETSTYIILTLQVRKGKHKTVN